MAPSKKTPGGAGAEAVDAACPLSGPSARVFVDGALSYAASLQQVGPIKGWEGINWGCCAQTDDKHDKFYVLQLVQDGKGKYHVWQRWGRTGTGGQSAIKGPFPLAEARGEFEAKYKEKTKNVFGTVFKAQPGKYVLASGAAAAGQAATKKATSVKAGKVTARLKAKAKQPPPKKAKQPPPKKAKKAKPALEGDVAGAWARYIAAFSSNGGGELPVYTPKQGGGEAPRSYVGAPATDEAIARLEEQFGQPLHPDLRALLKAADGAEVSIRNYNALLPCEDMINELATMRGLWEDVWKDDPDFNGANGSEEEYPGVKFAWWRPGWLPIGTDGGGNLMVMDYDPDFETGGVVGQIIDHDHETGDCGRVAKSLFLLFSREAEKIETGKRVWSADEEGYVSNGDDDDDDDENDDDDEEEDD